MKFGNIYKEDRELSSVYFFTFFYDKLEKVKKIESFN